MLRSYQGISPRIHESCYIDESAQIIGDVILGEHCSIWMNAVLRGDVELVAVLLDFGANPVAADDNGATPLKLATRGGNNTLVNLLSSHSASAKAGN